MLLALLLTPYLRKFSKFTVPDFVGERYYSQTTKLIAVVCTIFISFTYVAGQMRNVSVVFSRFLKVDITVKVIINITIVFFYAVIKGIKGITYTQVAQYCVLIFAYIVPAIFISILLTGNIIPQFGFSSSLSNGSGTYLLNKLDQLNRDLGFHAYTSNTKKTLNVFLYHRDPDDKHSWSAPRYHPFFYSSQNKRHPFVHKIRFAVYCDSLYNRACNGGIYAHEFY